jgi:predicted membrane metal-binding protein
MSNIEPVVAPRMIISGSDRNFGIVFAVVFALIGLWPMIHDTAPRFWALVTAASFLAAGVLRPQILSPLNQLWFRFGLLLHRVVNPVLMFLIYYGAVVPTGLVLKVLGKDVLRLKLDRAATSYWIIREPPGPAAGSMEKQF